MGDISARLRQRIWRDFPRPQVAEQVIRILGELPQRAGYDEEAFRTERIQAATVQFANGDITRFCQAIDLGTRDWRDLLCAAGLEHEDWPDRLDLALGPGTLP